MKIGKLQPAIVSGSFFFLVGSAALFRLTNYDIWWHLAAGRLIAGGGGIPRSDPFSFTARGTEWIDHEWLFQLIVFSLHRLGGPPALVLAKAAVILAAAVVVYRFVRRETGLPPAAAALIVAPFALAGRDRFIVRPELFTLLFSAILLDALFRSRTRRPTVGDLWWIPLLFVAWANIHGGMIVGLVLLGLFLLGRLMPWIWRFGDAAPHDAGRNLPRAGAVLVLLAAAGAAGLANPFFHRVYTVPFQLTSLIESGVFRNLEWIRPPWPDTWLYHLTLLAALLVIGMRLRRPDWVSIFPLLFLVAISWQYVRNIALFGMLAPLLLVRVWGARPRSEDTLTISRVLLGRGPAPAGVALVFALLGVFLLTGNHRFASGLGVDPLRVPARAVDFLEERRPAGNIFNAYAFGGYLAWRGWPEGGIFIDGRNEVFAELGREVQRARGDSRQWSTLLERHGIGHALLEYDPRLEQTTLVDPAGGPPRVVLRTSALNHFPRAHWALVHFDDTAQVLVRRSADHAELIEAMEYRHVCPGSIDVQLQLIADGEADAGQCRAELERKLRQDPSCRRARDLFAALDRLSTPSGS